ncbi:hypothetical protein GVN20_12020 [Runella sp. CRIBMP]|uniref:M91 family zinc metallopeptidase n=1 Tax=Runella sp. CRIBMP TaxID=2683261 RepID=UPI0014132BFF|nr:M91 family zinc metallopeptidase [Runella sp. CRIBMP]NBB20082.1 hypothetical protein [Runella sp. CRIBMP]
MSKSISFIYAPNIIVAPGTKYVDDFEDFQKRVLSLLADIMKANWTGLGIINLIGQMSNKKVIITPDPINGNACAEDRRNPSWGNAIEIPISVEYVKGTANKSPGFMPDEIILHELIHAYFMHHGTKQDMALFVPPNFYYHTFGEFAAVLLTNIYMSAKGRPALRRDHTEAQLTGMCSHDEGFLILHADPNQFGYPYSQFPHERLIWNLTQQVPELIFNYVRHENGVFNPVRYYLNTLPERRMRELRPRSGETFQRKEEFEGEAMRLVKEAERIEKEGWGK